MFLERVTLINYKSIARCDVHLRDLTFLVGKNGAGKSNFLDSLRFVTDALRTSLDHALRERGGIKEVRRRSSGHPTHFGVRLDFLLPDGGRGHYAFRIGARSAGGYEVQQEECRIVRTKGLDSDFFRVVEGQVTSSERVVPAAQRDRLYLVSASGLPQFRSTFDSLSRMGFYNLSPGAIRDLQPPDAGELLLRDGRNIASVLGVLTTQAPAMKARIEEYLSKVVPEVSGVDVKVIGPKETLEFRQRVAGSKDPRRFLATNMSDGTLRALGILVALFQTGNGAGMVPLVGIEEPEMALHPGAAGVLLDGLRDASRRVQILVTSHSPELLDDEDISNDQILAVQAADGVTNVAHLDEAGRSALRDRLFTAGELLRMNQLQPDPMEIRNSTESQMDLFESLEG